MVRRSSRGRTAHQAEVYRELEHPADLLLEIWGRDLPDLFANALFAFYDQSADLSGFQPRQELTLEVSGHDAAGALRALLAEALYRFDTERFVATEATVTLTADESAGTAGSGPVRVRAVLRGEKADPTRHVLTTEIKAVTYHLLLVEKTADEKGGPAWRATILFDI
jgi:SHS2 domain-containing protein